MEESVRQAGNKARIAVQLVDGNSGATLWETQPPAGITWAIEQTRRSADAIMAERREQLRLSGCH
jgi:TolB-like protein